MATLVVLLLLNLFDIYSTHYILTYKGGLELNPIMSAFMEKVGIIPAMAIWKGVSMLLLFAMLCLKMSRREMKVFLSLAVITNLLYMIIMATVNLPMM